MTGDMLTAVTGVVGCVSPKTMLPLRQLHLVPDNVPDALTKSMDSHTWPCSARMHGTGQPARARTAQRVLPRLMASAVAAAAWEMASARSSGSTCQAWHAEGSCCTIMHLRASRHDAQGTHAAGHAST